MSRVGRAGVVSALPLLATLVGCGASPLGPEGDDAAPHAAEALGSEGRAQGDRAGLASSDACYVCHMDLLEEPLAQAHGEAGVWCGRCHGPSAAHVADEHIGATPPDISYRKEDIERMCGECHEPEEHPEVPEETRSARLADGRRAQRAIKGEEIPVTAVCTDCHGRHWVPPLD